MSVRCKNCGLEFSDLGFKRHDNCDGFRSFTNPPGRIDYVPPSLTKRELFAAMAMQGMMSDADVGRWLQTDPRYSEFLWAGPEVKAFAKTLAVNAVEFADELLKELAKKEGK